MKNCRGKRPHGVESLKHKNQKPKPETATPTDYSLTGSRFKYLSSSLSQSTHYRHYYHEHTRKRRISVGSLMAEQVAQKERRILVAVDEGEESMYALSWCINNLVFQNSNDTLILLYSKPPRAVYTALDGTGNIQHRLL